MGKSLKLRISRVLQSCISKDPSTLPHNPHPLFLDLPPADPKVNGVETPATPPLPAPPRPSKSRPHHRRSGRLSLRSAAAAVGCGLRPRSSSSRLSDNESTECFKWQEEERWHVVAKVPGGGGGSPSRRKMYNSSVSAVSDDDVVLPPPPPPSAEKKMKRRGRKKKAKSTSRLVFRTSTSSAESTGTFSEDSENYNAEEEKEEDESETETLVSSSRSFSSDSSSTEFNPQLETIREAPVSVIGSSARRKKKKKKEAAKKKKRMSALSTEKGIRGWWSSPERESPARLSVFQRLIACRVEGKVRESYAVVKRSEEPYEDFKRSMMDMIVEKQMFEAQDLEQLLHCFLSLNSHHHHPLILAAFADIWEALFCRSSTSTKC